jgi:hypothetical protein
MATLHRLVAGTFAGLLDPVGGLPPLLGLTVISAVAGVALLGGMRLASDPPRIRDAKRRVQAHLLATRLYRHELLTVWRSLGALLLALGAYVAHMLRPFALLLIPFALLFAHLEARYAMRPLQPGERTILKAVASDGGADDWRIETPPGLVADSVAVRIPARREVDWRLRAAAPGEYHVTLIAGAERMQKAVQVGPAATGVAARREQASLAALFLAPREAPIAAGSRVAAIEVLYPPQRLSVFGWQVHWLVVFLVVSGAVAMLLRRRAGVEF